MMKGMVALALLVGFSAPALAAESYPEIIAHQGIAFSDEDEKTKQVTVYDTVAAYEHEIVVADCSKFSIMYKNVKWCFSTAENQKKFAADETNKKGNKYIPIFGGRCSQGVSNGNFKAEGDPTTAIVVHFSFREQDRALVLNGNHDVRADFLGDSAKNLSAARTRWDTAKMLGLIVPNNQVGQ